MRTYLNSKRNIPAVAFLCKDEITLSLPINGEFQLIRQNLVGKSEIGSSLKLKRNTKLLVVLSNQQVLYSQLKLPLNLSGQEIAELIELQLAQRHQGSEIDTYYDYFELQEFKGSAIFALFEARKDKLDRTINSLQQTGFKISLVIPQALLVLNQIIKNNDLTVKKFLIVCCLDTQVFIASVDAGELTGIRQIHITQNQSNTSLYTELLTQLHGFNVKTIINFGLDLKQFSQRLHSTNFEFIDFRPISAKTDLSLLSIEWMREQHGHYKSVALA